MSDLTPSQMRRIAAALSEQGRHGDSMLVHVTPEEVEMLKEAGGSGTTNPVTGLPEFWKVTEPGTWGDGKGYEGVGNFGIGNRGSARSSKSKSSPSGGSRSASSSSSSGGEGERETFFGGDNAFQTATNVMGFVSNPVGYTVGRVADGWTPNLGTRSDGDRRERPPRPRPDGQHSARAQRQFDQHQSGTRGEAQERRDRGEPANAFIAARAAGRAEGGEGEEGLGRGLEDGLEGSWGYRERSRFNSRVSGRELLDYEYRDGEARVTGTYNGNTRPYHFALTEASAAASSLAEQASAMVDDMAASLPYETADSLYGDISLLPTSDGKLAVVSGNRETGYVEASYEATQEGLEAAMGDIRSMFDYANETGDTDIDGGYIGRLLAYSKWGSYSDELLGRELENVTGELALYDPTTPAFRQALNAKSSIEREVARRRGLDRNRMPSYSAEAVEENIAARADAIVRS